ncbi:unnamed protein product, partial [Didymodactylos carnosus]
MEAYFILQGIVEVVIVIKNISYQVKANKKQCQRLVDRIYAIIAPLQTLENHELTSRPNIEKILNGLSSCIDDCYNLILKFTTDNWFKKVFKHNGYKQEFDELNRHLSQYANDLNLGLNIQQLFDRQQDEQDQETDLADINTKLDDITTLLTKQQEMQLQLPMHVDEMLNRRFKSLKYSLQQNILKTNNADYNNEEEKRKKEEQFLHIP